MTKVSIPMLLDAGAHFGHQTRRWNPKMKPYIFGSRGDIYIIDLKQTLEGLDRVYSFVSDLAGKGGMILFVGTKKQAQSAIADAANRCGMPYVNARWLGGMLTNFATIRSRVDYMEQLEAMEADGGMAKLPKKEQISLRKKLAKLQTNLNGIRNMKRVPDAVFIIDTNREYIAVAEARRLDIPVIGTLDTNCDPDDVEYGIPANDDAIRSVCLLTDFIADAVVAGTGADVTAMEMAGEQADAEQTVPSEDSREQAEESQEQAEESGVDEATANETDEADGTDESGGATDETNEADNADATDNADGADEAEETEVHLVDSVADELQMTSDEIEEELEK